MPKLAMPKLHIAQAACEAPAGRASGLTFARESVIALIAFLTVVDLFATQAILPSLAKAYAVTPAAVGFAVNASTMGMAAGGLGVALFGKRIDRRFGILISLAILAIPTALLASAPSLAIFTLLRIAQGLCMATAFTLALAYLGRIADIHSIVVGVHTLDQLESILTGLGAPWPDIDPRQFAVEDRGLLEPMEW